MKKITKRILVGVAGISAIIIPAIWNHLEKFFYVNDNIYNSRFFVLSVLLSAALVFSIMYLFIEEEKIKNVNLTHKLKNAELLLYHESKLNSLDHTTGVQNQLVFEEDIKTLSAKVDINNPVHIILIDLDKFGTVNNNHGHTKGSKLIRFIAQSVIKTMRRDEEIYKESELPVTSVTTKENKFYRMHRGGDEFTFIIRGDIDDALGFLIRLKSLFDKLSRSVNKELGIEQSNDQPVYDIKFHAGIVPLRKGVKMDVLMDTLDKTFLDAKNHAFNSSISWADRQNDNEYKNEPSYSMKLRAIKEFKI